MKAMHIQEDNTDKTTPPLLKKKHTLTQYDTTAPPIPVIIQNA